MTEKEEIILNDESVAAANGASPAKKEDHQIQHVADVVGDGRWQRQIFLFFFVCGAFSSWHSLGLAFYAPEVEYWCDNENWADVPKGAQLLEVRANQSLRCFDSRGEQCESWQYESDSRTLIEEFDLVCDRSWLVSAAKSFYMVGMLVAISFAQVADKYGRLPVVFGGIIVEIIGGLCSAFAPSMALYIASRFLLAMGNAARWGSGFVIILEVVGPVWRGDLGILIQVGWALGCIVMPFIAYFIRDFRYLQLACTLPEIAFVYLCYILIPESPRWQLINGRFRGAELTIREGAHKNKVENRLLDDEIELSLRKLLAKYQDELDAQKKNITFLDLWKTPNLRRKTLLLYFTWAVNGFVYYGFTFNTNSLGGNIYMNFFLSGLVEIPAYLLTMYILRTYGRRLPLAAAMFGTGLAFLLTLPFATFESLAWLRFLLAMAGKFCITSSFAIIYLYSGEIYPTVARTVGIGTSSMAARFGAIAAPYVKELTEATHISVTMAIFGLLAILNGYMVLMLPETHGKEIPDTIEQAERNDFDADDENPS